MDAYPVRIRSRRSVRRLLKGVLAATAALALSFAGVVLTPQLPGAQALQAGPAPAATTTTITATGAFSGTVPAGICTVTATVLGGAGGSAGVASVTNGNGAGASVTATFPVVPGLAYSGSVGGGGKQPTGNDTSSTSGAGGLNGGAAGGISGPQGSVEHHGAGGGGWSELELGGTTAVLAGGGGGGGGGHSTTTAGAGGDAGLPTTTGVTAGSDGNNGKDVVAGTTVQGGRGGTTAAAGAGGTNSDSPSTPGTDGVDGSGRNGGAGAADTNPDAGGGGGGGWFGGGGGASTNGYNSQNGSTEIAGAGGGGGSSYIAASVPLGSGISTPSGISSAAGVKIPTGAGNGANGAVSLAWNPCVYDLAVTKSVSPVNVARNSSVTWTVAVTNDGPAAMTLGDTVTIADTLPGAGAKTIASIAVTGGTDSTILANGAFTCNAAVGATMPVSLDCYRPYAIGAAAPVAGQYRGLNVGETLTVTYTQPITEVAGTVLTNTATVTDRTTGDTNDTASAATTVATPPVAVDDSLTGLAIGTVADLTVLTNDTGAGIAGSVKIMSGVTPVTSLVVAGQGTWSVVADHIVFSPLPAFKGDPTPIGYQITAGNGLTATATVTVTYVPAAVDDSLSGLAIGDAPSIAVLTNDNGDFDATSVVFASNGTKTLVVAGQGTWTVSGANVVFTPLPAFKTDPTPVVYRVTDTTGDQVTATVTLTYVPGAANDSSLGNTIGATVSQSVLVNDNGDFDAASVVFASTGGTTLVVAGQGTWTVQSGGVIRFVPEAGYKGDPTPVTYRVTDTTGDQVTALVTVGYVPAAADDSDLGNVMGTDVNVAILANDSGDFGSGNVRVLDGATPVLSLHVAGEGTWNVEPDDTITFVPDAGFLTDPTPVHYQVTDTTGDAVSALITVTYLPVAANDSDLGNVLGSTVNVTVLGNDTGSFVANSVRILDGATPVTSLVVAGEGEWRANSDGSVSFIPEAGFLVDPAPVDYQVIDTTGDVVSAQVTITYLPTVTADVKNGNTIGSAAVLNVLTNDTGTFDPATLRIVDPTSGLPVTTVVVAGQGTWTTDTTGHITFTPEPAYMGNPTPVTYQITDVTGDTVTALATVTYLPTASDDKSLGNPQGKVVTVPILTNDQGLFNVSTARLMSNGTPTMNLVVPGEGTWHMNAAIGEVTFTPAAGFTGDPTPVPYQVLDVNGNAVTANVTITYLHASALSLALTGMSPQTPLMVALSAIILGLALTVAFRSRRLVARHRI